jgi:uncharacterized SAM-dependent methyltransferase
VGEYVHDEQGGRHQAFYTPNRDVTLRDIQIKAGERVQVEVSLKYSPDETKQLWNDAGMLEVKRWSASTDEYSKFNSFVKYLLRLIFR